MPANGQNGTPAYQRIQSAIRERIEAGHLRPGDAVTSERELAKLNGVQLYPGMPAEVMIVTGERTLLQYLIQPVIDSFHRAFREE